MSANNNITLIGRIGADPELKSANGTNLAKVSLGTEQYNPSTKQRQTAWHRVSLWGKQADFVMAHCPKGSLVAVTGTLRYNVWEKDGVKHKDAEINADAIELLSKNEKASAPAPQPTSKPSQEPEEDFDPFG